MTRMEEWDVPYRNRYFEVRQAGPFYWIHEFGARAGACMLAALPSGEVLFVEVPRFALGGVRLEIPRGGSEDNEDSRQCACRELLEETGYDADPDSVRLLGHVEPNSGVLASKIAIFCCTVPGEPARPYDVNEIARVVRIPKSEIPLLIRDGRITDGFTLSAVALATAQGLL